MSQRRFGPAVTPVGHRHPLRPGRERWVAYVLLGVIVAAAVMATTRLGAHGATELSAWRLGLFVAFAATLAAVLARRGRQARERGELNRR